MRFHFTTIPVFESAAAAAALNDFLAAHTVLGVTTELVRSGTAWAVCVRYAERAVADAKRAGDGVDYKAVLPDDVFRLYAKLRELRARASAQHGVPVYAVFNNAQLAAMAKARAKTPAELAAIDGVGRARVEKYGEDFLALIRTEPPPSAPANDEGHGPP